MIKRILQVLAGVTERALGCAITPLELLFRPMFKSAAMLDITSKQNVQYAGRTTLESGSTTVTVSTQQVNSDSLINALVQVSLPGAYFTKGLLSIAAGAKTATQSTTAVYSGQYIGLSFNSVVDQASGNGRGFRVDSIVGGVSFAVVTEDGQNVTSGPANIGWNIPHAEPRGTIVTTIAPGAYFTLGWADGQARPVDTTLMWELRKTS